MHPENIHFRWIHIPVHGWAYVLGVKHCSWVFGSNIQHMCLAVTRFIPSFMDYSFFWEDATVKNHIFKLPLSLPPIMKVYGTFVTDDK